MRKTEEEERYYRNQARYYLGLLDIDPDELAKRYPRLAAVKPGRRQKGNDEDYLEGLEWHLRNFMKQSRMKKRRPALVAIISGIYGVLSKEDQQRLAKSAESLAARLEKKLRNGGYQDMKFKKTYWGSGVLVPILWALSPQ
jgi:hypothetical protein